MVIIALFLTGSGAGLFLFSLIPGFLPGMALGLASVIAGCLFLWADLHHPLRAWRLITRPQSSWMSRGIIGITSFAVLAFCYVVLLAVNFQGWTYLGAPWEHGPGWMQALAIAAGIDGQLAKAIFNRLGDRRLMDPTVPDREVLRELTLAADVYADFLRSARTRPVLRVGAPESDQAPRGSGTIALVAVAVPQSGHFSPTALSLPPGIRIVTFSRAECGDASIFLFRMSRCAPEAAGPQPLSPDEAKQVLELLTNWPQSTPESCSP